MSKVGLVSYGTYIPKRRLKISEIASAWGKNADEVIVSLGIVEKSVPSPDEDAVTLALEAAWQCMDYFKGQPGDIGAVFVGSESHPYAVNPTSTILAEFLGIGNSYLASDMEFACKAGTAGIQAVTGLVSSGQIKAGLSIGTDTAQSKPHDSLEYTSAAAAVACIIGRSSIIADLVSYTSFSSDTPDFWRRDGIRYPSHAGRFTGEPAYFTHVLSAAGEIMDKSKLTPDKIDWCVFHMPNGKFPRIAAHRLGFKKEQLTPSLTVDEIGNPYSASALLGFAKVLDIARPNQRILLVSYGSGAGSDAFIWQTTSELVNFQKHRLKAGQSVSAQIKNKTYINYVEYLKSTHKI